MTYSVNLKWMIWYFLNNHEEHPSKPACNAEALGILLYSIFHRNITSWIWIPFFPSTWARYLLPLIPWNVLVNHKHCQLFSSSLRMQSSSQIDEVKSSFVSAYAHVFSLLNSKLYFENYWPAENDMMENLLC